MEEVKEYAYVCQVCQEFYSEHDNPGFECNECGARAVQSKGKVIN